MVGNHRNDDVPVARLKTHVAELHHRRYHTCIGISSSRDGAVEVSCAVVILCHGTDDNVLVLVSRQVDGKRSSAVCHFRGDIGNIRLCRLTYFIISNTTIRIGCGNSNRLVSLCGVRSIVVTCSRSNRRSCNVDDVTRGNQEQRHVAIHLELYRSCCIHDERRSTRLTTCTDGCRRTILQPGIYRRQRTAAAISTPGDGDFRSGIL